MSDPEEQKGFKVTDRRLFDASGERRLDTDAESSDISEQTADSNVDPVDSPAPPSSKPRSEAQFIDLLSMLATQASLSLGEINPVTGHSDEDLQGAQIIISMIEVLQEKTSGNLSLDEAKAIEEILYALRTRFVSKAKAVK